VRKESGIDLRAFPSQVVEGRSRYTAEQLKRAKEVSLLHNVLNHPSDGKLIDCLQFGIIVGTPLTASDVRVYRSVYGPCKACPAGNATRESFETSLSEPAKQIGDIVHVDIDEFSGYLSLKPLKQKDQPNLEKAFYSLKGAINNTTLK
jgi:hypothetical protein